MKGFPTGAHHTRDTTHERDRSIECRLRCSSEAELQLHLHMRNSCTALHVMVNSLCTSLNSFTDPTLCGLSIAHGTFHLRGSVRTVHKQRLTSMKPVVNLSQARCATSTSAHRADCRRNRERGPRHHSIYRNYPHRQSNPSTRPTRVDSASPF